MAPSTHSGGGITDADRFGTSAVPLSTMDPAVEALLQIPEESLPLPLPTPEQLAASERLRIAAPYVAYLRQKAESQRDRRQILERVQNSKYGTNSLSDAELSELELLSEKENDARQNADAALHEAYRDVAFPPYEKAFKQDMSLLHPHILKITKLFLQQVWDQRQGLQATLKERYETSVEQRYDLGASAAIILACRSRRLPFIFTTEESTDNSGYVPELHSSPQISQISADKLTRQALWQPWVNDLNRHEGGYSLEHIIAYLGIADGIELRRSIFKAHPILALADRVWGTPYAMYREMVGEQSMVDPVAVGDRVFDAIYQYLGQKLDTLSINPATLETSSKSYTLARPAYLQSAIIAFCNVGRYGDVKYDPLLAVFQYDVAHHYLERGPKDKWKALDWLLAATGVAVLVAGIMLGPAFFGAALVLDLTIGAISTGIAIDRYQEAAKAAAMSDAEEAFRLLEEDLTAFETGQTAFTEGIIVALEVLLFALPITTTVAMAGRSAKPVKQTTKGTIKAITEEVDTVSPNERAIGDQIGTKPDKDDLASVDERAIGGQLGSKPDKEATELPKSSATPAPKPTTKAEEVLEPKPANTAPIHPDDTPFISAEPLPLDKRLHDLQKGARAYEEFQTREEFLTYLQNDFAEGTRNIDPDEVDRLFMQYVNTVYGSEVANRGLWTSLDSSTVVGFAGKQKRLVDEAVQNGTRLDSLRTHYTIRREASGSKRKVVVGIINIRTEIIDVPDINGVPCVVLNIIFQRSEFQALDIGNYEQRIISRYNHANAQIVEYIDWDGHPPVLLPKAIKDADRKTASQAHIRHTPVGSGYEVNVDEPLQRAFDGGAHDGNQILESDIINGIYSKADNLGLKWAREQAGKRATIGIAGINVVFQ